MKKNLLKIPPTILERLRQFDQDDVAVATAKLLTAADVARYAKLGLLIEGGVLKAPPPTVPAPSAGRYSKANVFGHEVIRRDLPMVSKEFGFWAPDWGDWSKGSHYVSHTRDVYQRDFYPPKEVELTVDVLETRSNGFVVKFGIDQVINRRTPNFEQELLYNLNILQENVGAADVFPSAATLAEYAETVRVDWQILPPGSVDEIVKAMLAGKRPVAAEQAAIIERRIKLLAQLRPEAYVAGSDGFLRYFGAKFGDDFVVFENARYGNALYVMYEDWTELSRRSRVELLAGPRDSFDRIPHRDGWEEQLKGRVTEYRRKKRRGR